MVFARSSIMASEVKFTILAYNTPKISSTTSSLTRRYALKQLSLVSAKHIAELAANTSTQTQHADRSWRNRNERSSSGVKHVIYRIDRRVLLCSFKLSIACSNGLQAAVGRLWSSDWTRETRFENTISIFTISIFAGSSGKIMK